MVLWNLDWIVHTALSTRLNTRRCKNALKVACNKSTDTNWARIMGSTCSRVVIPLHMRCISCAALIFWFCRSMGEKSNRALADCWMILAAAVLRGRTT